MFDFKFRLEHFLSLLIMPSISTTLPTDVPIYSSLAEFDRNLPPTVKLLHADNGAKVYLIGTAHFSRKSQDDVSLVMQNVRPDKLVLELCPLRLHILHFDEERLLRESADLNYDKVREILRQHGLIGGMFYIKFLNINASVTRQLGIAPGGECRRALAEAERLPNCEVLLGDRSIYVTMQRAIRSMSLVEKLQLSLFYAFFQSNAKITHDDVEQLKTKTAAEISNTDGAVQKPQPIPAIYNAFVLERDMLLSHSLRYAASGQRKDPLGTSSPVPLNVVGVVGIGHSSGILQNWNQKLTQSQVDDLLSLPAEKLSYRLVRGGLKYGLIGLCGYGLYKVVFGSSKKDDSR